MKALTVEKSQEFAAAFEWLKLYMLSMDWEYAALVVEKLRERASIQETMIVVNSGYPLAAIDLIRAQAQALSKFVEGIELLKKCDEIKARVETESAVREEIKSLFL